MSVHFFTGFDYAPTNSTTWNLTAPTRSTSPVRSGSHASIGNCERDIGANIATAIWGGGIYRSGGLPALVLELKDGSGVQVDVVWQADLSMQVRRGGGTVLGTTAAGLFPLNAWNYLELKALIHPSAGTVDLRLNGVNKLSLTSQNTRNTANSFVNRYFVSTLAGFDDHYLCDASGSSPWNDFLGDIKVETLYADGAGTYAEWTPSAGSNFQNVDDPGTPDDDSTYNKSSTANQRDIHALANLATTSGQVFAVQEHIFARKDDTGTREAATMIRSNTTEVVGTTNALGLTYVQYSSAIFEQDPATTAQWTISNVNALGAGYKLIS